jgi:hypothetical protein
MGKYYYLISGLPELQLDDLKLKITMADFKTELEEHLSNYDKSLCDYFFMQFDNINLLRYLNDPEADFHPLGNISASEFGEIMLLFKETDTPAHPMLPEYFKDFIPAYMADKALFTNMGTEDQLASLYYDYAANCNNDFISAWFRFNLNLNNILTATNCRKYNLDREAAVVGTGEISEAIRYSNSRDFGIAAEFPEVENVLRLAEINDIIEREQKIDKLKWEWLEENGFFHYFDVEHLFIYLIKLQMLSRWVKLEKETGLKIFREMIYKLQHSFEFPNEFTIRKVK